MGVSSSKRKNEDILLDEPIKQKYKILNNKLQCPIIGIGTSLINEKKDIDIIYQSIKDGVRLIDTDPSKEELVGEGINRAINEGIVKRKDLFIVTKLELEEKEEPEEALRKSLERLQLEYVDLYIDHWPSCMYLNDDNNYRLIPVKDTWEQMEILVDKKLTRAIGVSNYNVQNLINILSICKYKPAVNEVEFHPYLYQKDLKEFCDKENIILFAYNPLAKGIYNDENFAYDKKLDLFKENIICDLMKKNNSLTEGQLILNWHICLGVVPITGTSNPSRMKENLNSINFKLNEDNISLLCSFKKENKQYRFNDGTKIFGYNIFE